MRFPFSQGFALFAALLIGAPVVAQQAHGAGHDQPAATARVGAVTITDAYVRAPATPNGAAAAYMTIAIADGADRLLSAATDVAQRVELHTHLVDANGVARMREIPAIEIAAGAPATLAPGGLHVMMMGVVAPIMPGGTVALTLSFEQAGAVTLDMPVRAIGAQGHGARHGAGHGSGQMKHGG